MRTSFSSLAVALVGALPCLGCVQQLQSGAVTCSPSDPCPSGFACTAGLCVLPGATSSSASSSSGSGSAAGSSSGGEAGGTTGAPSTTGGVSTGASSAGATGTSSAGTTTSGSSASSGSSGGGSSTGAATTTGGSSGTSTGGSGSTGCTPNPDAFRSAVLADSPLVYYRMDETSGSVMVDSSSSGLNGSYGASVLLGQSGLVPSDPGSAPHFPGGAWTDAGIAQVPPIAAMASLTAFSVELFLEEDVANQGDGGYDGYVDVVDYGIYPSAAFGIQINPEDQLDFYLPFAQPSDTEPVATTALAPQQAWLIDATYGAGTALLYANGALVAETTSAGTLQFAGVGSVGLGIGSTAAPQTRSLFQGKISQLSIYGGALTATQIASHYQASGLGGGCP